MALELADPVEKVEAGVAPLEAQPRVVRGPVMRQIVEKWLEGQGKADRGHSGN